MVRQAGGHRGRAFDGWSVVRRLDFQELMRPHKLKKPTVKATENQLVRERPASLGCLSFLGGIGNFASGMGMWGWICMAGALHAWFMAFMVDVFTDIRWFLKRLAGNVPERILKIQCPYCKEIGEAESNAARLNSFAAKKIQTRRTSSQFACRETVFDFEWGRAICLPNHPPVPFFREPTGPSWARRPRPTRPAWTG
jgi:hypothetical protein